MKKILIRGLFIVLLMILFVCPHAMAEGVSNTFVGTVDGEPITAYLDYTYAFSYGDGFGGDIDALFVSFDEDGKPEHQIGIRITDNTEERTYSEGNGKKIDYTSIRMVYDPETLQFNDYYRIVESATDWKITFTEIDRESGVIKGTVKATLTPSKYSRDPYPLQNSVKVEGSFEFQLHTIHPVMEEYRSYYPDYAEKYEVEYYQGLGEYSAEVFTIDDSGSGSTKKKASQFCDACNNTRHCHVCSGMGYTFSNYLGNFRRHTCSICHGTGVCQHYK